MRRKLPFALTWWSFTFPVGTVVTGTTQLAKHTGLPAFGALAILFFFGLLCAWLTVGFRTLRGAYRTDLLIPQRRRRTLWRVGRRPDRLGDFQLCVQTRDGWRLTPGFGVPPE